MTQYYAVREVECTPEQLGQIYSLAKSNMGDDSSGFYVYEANRWEFIVFEESEEIYQCNEEHFNERSIELISPEEAILRLFEIYLEN